MCFLLALASSVDSRRASVKVVAGFEVLTCVIVAVGLVDPFLCLYDFFESGFDVDADSAAKTFLVSSLDKALVEIQSSTAQSLFKFNVYVNFICEQYYFAIFFCAFESKRIVFCLRKRSERHRESNSCKFLTLKPIEFNYARVQPFNRVE